MSTGIQACEIVLPGYVLTERIGSGGYAEVWRAEAPGGIAKAVKIVYGYYDDEFASQELKALERIKGVRHPFLLSLERFEVLNGRLAILTELADMSLDQRLRQCRAEGLSGIPRQELLRYMADAAEALDFLSQRHSLLHLDIKPENLLILGDHIKVADFGLVKELATRTQNSLVSGMTPTYSSPEMFDDEPSAHSDQYSLAIVYQEMLVGCLPFPGRTAAQLAKQHTQSEPQLMSLPADDRGIIAKALAKKPVDRFPSCRAFVDSLLGARKHRQSQHRRSCRGRFLLRLRRPRSIQTTRSQLQSTRRSVARQDKLPFPMRRRLPSQYSGARARLRRRQHRPLPRRRLSSPKIPSTLRCRRRIRSSAASSRHCTWLRAASGFRYCVDFARSPLRPLIPTILIVQPRRLRSIPIVMNCGKPAQSVGRRRSCPTTHYISRCDCRKVTTTRARFLAG